MMFEPIVNSYYDLLEVKVSVSHHKVSDDNSSIEVDKSLCFVLDTKDRKKKKEKKEKGDGKSKRDKAQPFHFLDRPDSIIILIRFCLRGTFSPALH